MNLFLDGKNAEKLSLANQSMANNFFVHDFVVLLQQFRERTCKSEFLNSKVCFVSCAGKDSFCEQTLIKYNKHKFIGKKHEKCNWKDLEVLIFIVSVPHPEPIGHFFLIGVIFDNISEKKESKITPFVFKCDSLNSKTLISFEETKIMLSFVKYINSVVEDNKVLSSKMDFYLKGENNEEDDVLRLKFEHGKQTGMDCGFYSIIMATMLSTNSIAEMLANCREVGNSTTRNSLLSLSSKKKSFVCFYFIYFFFFEQKN